MCRSGRSIIPARSPIAVNTNEPGADDATIALFSGGGCAASWRRRRRCALGRRYARRVDVVLVQRAVELVARRIIGALAGLAAALARAALFDGTPLILGGADRRRAQSRPGHRLRPRRPEPQPGHAGESALSQLAG